MTKIFLSATIIAFLLLAAACGSMPTQTPDSAAALAAQRHASSKHEYEIGPGDMLNVFVWRQPDLSINVAVRPDGKISTPLIDEITAAGKTPKELARELEDRLSRYVKTPDVTVIVTQFANQTDQQVRVVGEVTTPQAIPYRESMTLLDVLIAVGGLTEFASGNRAMVVRTVDGEERKIHVRVEDLMKKGDIKANIAMQPGDVLIIPESWF